MPQIKDPQIYFTNSAEKHVSQEMNPAIMQVSAFVAATWKTRESYSIDRIRLDE